MNSDICSFVLAVLFALLEGVPIAVQLVAVRTTNFAVLVATPR